MNNTILKIARRTPLFPYLRAYYTVYLKKGLGPSLKTMIIGSHKKDIIGFRGEFDELLERYRQELHRYIDDILGEVESVRDEPSPLLSLLFLTVSVTQGILVSGVRPTPSMVC